MTKDDEASRQRLALGVLALLTAPLLTHCTSEPGDTDPGASPPDSASRPAQQPVAHQTRYEFSIHPDLPPYVFELDTTESQIRVSTADGTAAQSMDLGPELLGLGGGRIEALDYDFDGYADIRYPWNVGSGGTWYATWLFDPAASRFTYDAFLSELASPEVNAEQRTVTAHEIGGWAGLDYRRQTYRYGADGYALVRDASQTLFGGDGEDLYRRVVALDASGAETVVCELALLSQGETGQRRVLLDGWWDECGEDPYALSRPPGFSVERVEGDDWALQMVDSLLRAMQASQPDRADRWIDAEAGFYLVEHDRGFSQYQRWSELAGNQIFLDYSPGGMWLAALRETDLADLDAAVREFGTSSTANPCNLASAGVFVDATRAPVTVLSEIHARQSKEAYRDHGIEPSEEVAGLYRSVEESIARRVVVAVEFPDMMAVASLYFAFGPSGWQLAIMDVRDDCVR